MWGAKQRDTFQKLQQTMNHLPTLQAPVRGKPLLLYLASTSQVIEALLAQEYDKGNKHPIYYVSKASKDA